MNTYELLRLALSGAFLLLAFASWRRRSRKG